MRLIYWLLGLEETGAIERASEWTWYAAAPTAGIVIAVVGLLAVAAAALNLLPQNVMPWRTRLGLTALRLFGFALLLVLLVQLELRLTVQRRRAPNVAILCDTSGSMGLKDVAGKSRLDAAVATDNELQAALDGRCDVARYDFAWQLQAANGKRAAEGMTNLMGAVAEISRRENDLQAVILLTDGNDTARNRGDLVAPLLADQGVPVYPVVFGQDTAPKLAQVRIKGAGDYVRLSDEVRITAEVSARNLEEQIVRVHLYQAGKKEPLVTKENVRIGKASAAVAFIVKPAEPGFRTYRVVVDGVKGTTSDRLLVSEHQVEVIDSRIRVLYLDIPRDERKILGHWLARDPVIDLATLTMLPKGGWYAQGNMYHKNAGDGLPSKEEDLYQYDIIVFGDIPRAYFREGGDVAETKMRWLAEFVARRGGGLITLGGRNVYAAGQYQESVLASLLPFKIEATDQPQIKGTFSVSPTTLGLGHPIMQLEPDPERNREAWLDLPQLEGCNTVGPAKPGAALLAVRLQESGPAPVIAVQNVGKGKVLALSVDTTWRWEMQRPADGPDYFRRFWGNAIRVLAPDPRLQPGRPQVQRYRSNVAVGQQLTMSTRLVSKTYRPVRGANVRVRVAKPSGKEYSVFPRDGRGTPGLYEYDLDIDEPGQWSVTTSYEDKEVLEQFSAGDSREELQDPRARPQPMARLAEATGGKLFTADQLASLLKELKLSPRHDAKTYTIAIWNRPLVMILIVLAVALDCLIRKRRGMV